MTNKKNILFRPLAILVALMLIWNGLSLTAQAAGNKPGDGNTSSSSVDHIDIGVSLTADIMIDGVLYEDLTYTLQKSDLTKANLSISSSTGGHTYSLNNVTNSTGASGIEQFRISGTFPVGTMDKPVSYTVTLNKTVPVTTESGTVVNIPVTFTASFQYWDSHNDCPGLENDKSKWQSGSVIQGSGLDFLLGNAEGDVNTKGTITIQKTLAGLELAEGETKTFTFDIYTADGKLYDTITATVGSESPYATTSLSEVPFGTYYIIERDAAVEDYTLGVEYTVGGNASADKSGDITLTEDAPNGSAYVTNTYTAIPEPPTEPETEPTEPETEPTEPETEPTEPETEPTEPETEPTEPETEPTEPETEPTEPETEPTEPETEPTEPETEPTEPETEPTEPETEPTEPETEPTEPETEPTEPETEPTEPETEPTEPETEPTEPETEPTESGMADVPQTGDSTLLWAALSILSGSGLLTIALPGKKKDGAE